MAAASSSNHSPFFRLELNRLCQLCLNPVWIISSDNMDSSCFFGKLNGARCGAEKAAPVGNHAIG